MCWFNNEDKERIETLEQQVYTLTDEICKLIKALGKLEIKIDKYIQSDISKEM